MRLITESPLLPLLLAFPAVTALAGPLSGTSGQFTLPSLTGSPSLLPGTLASVAAVGANHTGTWATPANSAWWGTYQGTGPIPASASSGAITLDFTTLNALYLPASTYVRLGDLDSLEGLTMRAFDASGALVTSHWLTDLLIVTDNNPGNFTQAFMPSWAFNSTTGVYSLTGESASGNPNSTYVTSTTTNLSRIELTKVSSFAVSFAANEVPEPATLTLLGSGLLALGFGRRRRNLN